MVEIKSETRTEQSVPAEPTFINTFSEILNSFLQIAQQNILDRARELVDQTLDQAKEAANQIIQNAVILFAIILFGLIGFVFAITGLSLWLGEVSGFGAWFGFLIIGTIVFIAALITGLLQKNKQL